MPPISRRLDVKGHLHRPVPCRDPRRRDRRRARDGVQPAVGPADRIGGRLLDERAAFDPVDGTAPAPEPGVGAHDDFTRRARRRRDRRGAGTRSSKTRRSGRRWRRRRSPPRVSTTSAPALDRVAEHAVGVSAPSARRARRGRCRDCRSRPWTAGCAPPGRTCARGGGRRGEWRGAKRNGSCRTPGPGRGAPRASASPAPPPACDPRGPCRISAKTRHALSEALPVAPVIASQIDLAAPQAQENRAAWGALEADAEGAARGGWRRAGRRRRASGISRAGQALCPASGVMRPPRPPARPSSRSARSPRGACTTTRSTRRA